MSKIKQHLSNLIDRVLQVYPPYGELREQNQWQESQISQLQQNLEQASDNLHVMEREYQGRLNLTEGEKEEALKREELFRISSGELLEDLQTEKKRREEEKLSFQTSFRLQEEHHREGYKHLEDMVLTLQEQVQRTASLKLRHLFTTALQSPIATLAKYHGVKDLPSMYAKADEEQRQTIEQLKEELDYRTGSALLDTIESAHEIVESYSNNHPDKRVRGFSNVPYAIYTSLSDITFNGFEKRSRKNSGLVTKTIKEALNGNRPEAPIQIGRYQLHIRPHNLFKKPVAVSAYLLKEKRQDKIKNAAGRLRDFYERQAVSLANKLDRVTQEIKARNDLQLA